MNDFIEIPLEAGSQHYLNLEKIIEIRFKEVINKEMEKRILQ